MYRRIVALLVSLSVLVPFCSCSSGAQSDDVVEAAEVFAMALLSRDADKLPELITENNSGAFEDFEDLFDDSLYSHEQNRFIEAVADTITYEVDASSVVISKNTASVNVVFTMVDYEAALAGSEFYDIDQVVSAVGSCDEVIEQTVTFEFEKVDDVWLLSNLGDLEELFSFCSYGFVITLDPFYMLGDTEIRDDIYSICMETSFTGNLNNLTSFLTFDVYLDGELVAQDQPALISENNVLCIYSGPDDDEIPAGEYEIRLNYDDEELCSSSITVERHSSGTEGPDEEPDDPSGSPDADPVVFTGPGIKVGIINLDPNESGYRSMNDLSLMNVFLIDDIYGYYDALFFESMHSGEQIQEALDYIDAGVEYLLINPAEPTGWDEVVSEAYDAGVKVIFFDQIADVDPSYYLTYVHNDTYLSAQEAVSWLANEGLPEYNIIHLQGVPGSSAQIDRTAALDEMVAAHGNWNYVIQESGYCDYNTAKIIVRNVIDSGEDFNVIYAENDHMASGAEAALDEAGISHGLGGDVMIVSFDSTYYGLESVGNGYWNYDQQCNPDQASYIDAVIRDYENGIVPPSEIIVDDLGFDARTITSEDIDEYGI